MKKLLISSCVVSASLFACAGHIASPVSQSHSSNGTFEMVGRFNPKHVSPAFDTSMGRAVPIDILASDLSLKFDPVKCSIQGFASLDFVALGDGLPYFDLVPNAYSVMLDGKNVEMVEINDPDLVTKLRLIKTPLSSSETHKLQISYDIISIKPTCTGQNTARLFFDMTDFHRQGRGFWENYGPANLEFDQFPLSLRVEVLNTNMEHRLEVNGDSTLVSKNKWDVAFPDHYNAASFFVHLFPKDFYVRSETVYKGMDRDIPVVIYAPSQGVVNSALKETMSAFQQLESAYGAYPHPKFTAYVTGQSGGGMEFAGATITSVWALSHELAHSWFARGVMPASGNSGWIDEAIASWSAEGFERAAKLPKRNPVKLDGYSLYKRSSVDAAYYEGKQFISELDLLFANQGGMKALLKKFFGNAKHTVIQTMDLKTFLEKETTTSLQAYFARYVYGKDEFGFEVIQSMPERGNPYHKMLPSQLE